MGFRRRHARRAAQHRLGTLVERLPHHSVAAIGDASVIVHLARDIALGYQAAVRPDRPRALVVPHVARILVGPGFSRLLPLAMLLGAGYLLLVDTLARSLSTVETPLGILTALVGAPFFLWLLARGRTGWA
jgi:ABC-type cobalamin transport system permease subunit